MSVAVVSHAAVHGGNSERTRFNVREFSSALLLTIKSLSASFPAPISNMSDQLVPAHTRDKGKRPIRFETAESTSVCSRDEYLHQYCHHCRRFQPQGHPFDSPPLPFVCESPPPSRPSIYCTPGQRTVEQLVSDELPIELKDVIFELVFADALAFNPPPSPIRIEEHYRPCTLLHINKATRREFAKVFYGHPQGLIANSRCLKWWGSVAPEHKNMVEWYRWEEIPTKAMGKGGHIYIWVRHRCKDGHFVTLFDQGWCERCDRGMLEYEEE